MTTYGAKSYLIVNNFHSHGVDRNCVASKDRRRGRQFAMCGGSLCNLALGWKCRCVDEALIVEVVDIGACVPLAV